ncbi:MAG: hypothetical protein EA397_02070 [Deltaproteobacteria bacterium]|nr:MAG: hypothetical protein EA397_02070 [Deltaproteobacteria bacterium]
MPSEPRVWRSFALSCSRRSSTPPWPSSSKTSKISTRSPPSTWRSTRCAPRSIDRTSSTEPRRGSSRPCARQATAPWAPGSKK